MKKVVVSASILLGAGTAFTGEKVSLLTTQTLNCWAPSYRSKKQNFSELSGVKWDDPIPGANYIITAEKRIHANDSNEDIDRGMSKVKGSKACWGTQELAKPGSYYPWKKYTYWNPMSLEPLGRSFPLELKLQRNTTSRKVQPTGEEWGRNTMSFLSSCPLVSCSCLPWFIVQWNWKGSPGDVSQRIDQSKERQKRGWEKGSFRKITRMTGSVSKHSILLHWSFYLSMCIVSLIYFLGLFVFLDKV